ncbi:Protein of unknown function [Lactobacillus delbrueckii subsp. bulgaricus]|nr:Protein of unknown function [Lactobacillus delbrueckii subsp. bulgaricus]
MVRMIGE